MLQESNEMWKSDNRAEQATIEQYAACVVKDGKDHRLQSELGSDWKP